MTKKGTQGTNIFGPPVEAYISQLLQLHINQDGSKRPDLISNGNYNPHLTIEVKGSERHIGILYDGQHYYALNLGDDYLTNFGRILPRVRRKSTTPTTNVPVAYYYANVHRTDGIKRADLDRPYATLNFELGDVQFVPSSFAFFYFAVQRALSEKRDTKSVVRELKQRMARDYKEGSSYYRDERKKSENYKGLYPHDFRALFFKDMSLTTSKSITGKLNGKQRIEALRKIYPEVDDLVPIELPGPFETRLYALCDATEVDLFDTQMRSIIQERKPIMEEVIGERRRARKILMRMDTEELEGYCPDSGPIAQEIAKEFGLSKKLIQKLERLVQFVGPNETPLKTQAIEGFESVDDEIPI